MTCLELRKLTKRFGSSSVLKSICLQSLENEFISLVGPSGCGKTTLLRIIAGLESADSGEVVIADHSVADLPPHERNVAMVFQGESLYPHMNVLENLTFPLRMAKRPANEIRTIAETTAKQLGVHDLLQRLPGTLSGGQRQRIALGRALVRRPKVFLFDEPFSHLDTQLRKQLRRELMQLRNNWDATTIFVTHDQREAMLMGDRVVVMNEGEILQFDTPNKIQNSPSNKFVAEFMDDAP